MRSLTWVEGAIGADEAGRGPLAGPVVAAAVFLPDGFDTRGLDDSKRLTPAKRHAWAERIRASAIWEIEFADREEIDRVNILHASEAAIARAVSRLAGRCAATLALVDGHRVPPGMPLIGRAEIKGDGRFAPIAAASVLAKTTRDEYMTDLDARHPEYGFAAHFGYPTPVHLAALREHGPCAEHRRSFRPVADSVSLFS